MYVCVFLCMSKSMCLCEYLETVCIRVCVHICIRLCVSACKCVCENTSVCACVRVGLGVFNAQPLMQFIVS